MSVPVIPSFSITCFKKRRKTRFVLMALFISQDLEVILIDCRSKEDFENNHIVGALSIPYSNLRKWYQSILDQLSDPSTHAATSSSVCNLPLQSDRHAYLLFYGEQNQASSVYREYQSLSLPLRLLCLQDSFDSFAELFPFITTKQTAVSHGIFPICILPNKLYITSQYKNSAFFI